MMRSLSWLLCPRLCGVTWFLSRLMCLCGVYLWIGFLLGETLILGVWMSLPYSALYMIRRLKTTTIWIGFLQLFRRWSLDDHLISSCEDWLLWFSFLRCSGMVKIWLEDAFFSLWWHIGTSKCSGFFLF